MARRSVPSSWRTRSGMRASAVPPRRGVVRTSMGMRPVIKSVGQMGAATSQRIQSFATLPLRTATSRSRMGLPAGRGTMHRRATWSGQGRSPVGALRYRSVVGVTSRRCIASTPKCINSIRPMIPSTRSTCRVSEAARTCVHEVDAGIECGVNDVHTIGMIDIAPLAEHHRAQAQGRDLDASAAQAPELHRRHFPWYCGRRPPNNAVRPS